MQIAIPKKMSSLGELLDAVSVFLNEQDIDGEPAFAITLAVDEIFSNFVKHQAMGKQNIEVELKVEQGCVKAIMKDYDVDEYDFTKQEPADMDKLAADASPGGRGLYLTNQVMDKIEYAYANRTCTVTLTKFLGSTSV